MVSSEDQNGTTSCFSVTCTLYSIREMDTTVSLLVRTGQKMKSGNGLTQLKMRSLGI